MEKSRVYLQKKIPGEDLERILIAAAGDIGLRAESYHKYKEAYTCKQGLVKKVEEYDGTIIRLSEKVSLAEIGDYLRGFDRRREHHSFLIRTKGRSVIVSYSPVRFGFGSVELAGYKARYKESIKKYLAAVSGRIEAYQG